MRQILTKQLQLLLGATILLWAFSSSIALAQTPCGDITGPEQFFIHGPSTVIVTEPVVNCLDPFDVTTDPASPYTLLINGEAVPDGGTVAVVGGRTRDVAYEGQPTLDVEVNFIFKHENDDYIYVDQTPPEPTTADYIQYASTYFPTQQQADFYLTIFTEDQATGNTDPFFYDENSVEIFDENTSETVRARYTTFIDNANYYFESAKPLLESGTYTLVIRESEIILSSKSIFDRIKDFILPTAHAQWIGIGPYTYAITFTLTELVPEPTGASSVLFLPGIMGSRLYEKGDFCEGDSLNSERQLWFSLNECLQLRLTTQFTGQSVNPVYTKSGTAGVLEDAFAVVDIYDTFLESLEDWKNDEIIQDYVAFPYDWRVELDDIIKSTVDENTNEVRSGLAPTVANGYLYQKLEELASSSKSGKVTIVAHSNGGLVAKHFLSALESTNDPLASKIDNLILVAVPQIGTPDSAIGILHGLELGPNGIVMSQQIARQLSNKMAFSHHLLPTLSYFNSVDTPIITFEEGSSTNSLRDTYGESIDSRDELHQFLDDDSGREKPVFEDLSTPEVVDGLLLNYAKVAETIQSNWVVPETLKVYQIAGTGLETPSGITYFTDRECVSRNLLFTCTEYKDKLGYRVNMVIDGDESVVAPSALTISTGDENVERWWLNLLEYNDDFLDRKHKNILEVQEVIDFVNEVVQRTTSQAYLYLGNQAPVFNNKSNLVFQLHSPLDMSLVTLDGKGVSSSTNEINGATYRRYGELQYISIPDNEDNFVLNLNGLATGSFTLDVEEVDNGGVTNRRTYSAIPSSTSTKVTFAIGEEVSLGEAVIQVDYQGDGIVDVEYDTEGVVEEAVTYQDLYTAIKNLGLKKLFEQTLINTAKVAEKFYEKSLIQSKYEKLEGASLQVLKKQLSLYEKIRLISGIQRQSVEVVINSLIDR